MILSARLVHAQPDLSPLQRPSRPMIEAARQHYASGTIGLLAGGGALVVGGVTWAVLARRGLK
ncbi:MAG: hypothetical protein JNM83_02850 [Myxococcales bacterium]|nr:hypothetical protein [Myxococcales bacterium]